VEPEITCPFGSKCEEIRDNKQYRCALYTRIAGTKPDGETVDEFACAIAWLPVLQLEMSKTNRGQTAALESFRNETVTGQQQFNQIMATATQKLEN
jgi:hypothetical protein